MFIYRFWILYARMSKPVFYFLQKLYNIREWVDSELMKMNMPIASVWFFLKLYIKILLLFLLVMLFLFEPVNIITSLKSICIQRNHFWEIIIFDIMHVMP